MTTQNSEKKEMKWEHWVLGIVFGIGLIAAIVLYCGIGGWFHLAGLGIMSFLLSLVCMDCMTYRGRKKLRQVVKTKGKEIKKLEGEIKEMEKQKNASSNTEQIDQLKEENKRLKEELDELQELPLADRMALIFPETVEVLDRHEIRRALVISLTVVYMILLFQGKPVVEHFTWVYLTIIGFYFGSRSLEKYAEIRKETEKVKAQLVEKQAQQIAGGQMGEGSGTDAPPKTS